MNRDLALKLFTTTRMRVAEIAREAGGSAVCVWRLARLYGVKRPPPAEGEKERKRPAGSGRRKGVYEFGSNSDALLDRNLTYQSQVERDRKHLLKLWNDGLDLDAIAIRLRSNRGAVRSQLKRLGIDPKAPRRLRTVEEKLAIRGPHIMKPGRGDWQRRA